MPIRQPLLPADPRLRGEQRQAGRGDPAAGRTPSGAEVALVLRHVVKAIRARWPRVGDPGARRQPLQSARGLTWCERNRVGYVFGLAGDQVLLARSPIWPRTRRSAGSRARATRCAAAASPARRRSWQVERALIGRVEASPQGSDSRFIIANLAGAPRWLYEERLLPRGQAEPGQGARAPPRLRSHPPAPARRPISSAC